MGTSSVCASKPRVLYIDPLCTPSARQNVLGIYNAYRRVAHVKLFDYRAGVPPRGRQRRPAIQAMNLRLLKTAQEFKPDLVHVGKGEIVLGSTVAQIKRATGAFVFHAFGDWRTQLLPYVWQIGSVADVTGFSNMHPGINQRYSRLGVSRIEFWCAGFDPAIYRAFDLPRRLDTVFMANMGKMTPTRIALQGPREKFIYALAASGVDVHLFGRGTALQASRSSRVYAHGYVTGMSFSQACSQAKIALGFGVHNVKNYTSWPRLVNSMASGTLYVTRYFLGLENFFVNKQHLAWFKTIPEGVQLVRHYLAHPEEREAIAEAGRQKVLASHTWDARIRQVLQWVNGQ